MQVIEDSESKVYGADDIKKDLSELINKYSRGKVFLLMDTGSHQHCYPKIKEIPEIDTNNIMIIEQGDHHKNIETIAKVWHFLSTNGADRKSLLINLAGGMPCDLGGFAAATFKRGIDFINIPTTLLSQVDASVGGKTGINFHSFKNEIGVFKHAVSVLVCNDFIKTQDQQNIFSGFAEMIKHALIFSEDTWNQLKVFDIRNTNIDALKPLVINSIHIKEHFVKADPTEQNVRKSLNFGHTIGHAFESFAMQNNTPILHGFAVAYGMIVELYLGHKNCGFPLSKLQEINRILSAIYGHFTFSQKDFESLFYLMTHDKKNEKNKINFTLLEDIGQIKINQTCTKEEIFEALEFYLNQ
ncbi:3-dehydroquinate synthase [Saccharicrinis fermentans]|uniref:3-dehydroquinate synthase n=1 Tax=Saccharicrinis fermentans DSM 9555 = JCM 21142 TaxID=869213 RepID=W7Y623_9BACT|nr:3-dehydroquinate synthase [Saccharicrinis fermentans]GAF03587.1 3-dehydroquinate synthase [Saccharicrinis fermentans DSM 9555 = JCM 21142]